MDSALAEAAAALAAGGVVCFPTESSYGLAARLDRPAACAKIAAIKDRPPTSPFPVIAASLEDAKSLARSWPAAANDLAARFWPGPLTLVVPARAELPAEVVGPTGGVGVRVSPHPIAHALATDAGPITATSANLRGSSPALTARAAREALPASIVFVDGGECEGGSPSTVVAVGVDGALTVIRAGAIDLSPLV